MGGRLTIERQWLLVVLALGACTPLVEVGTRDVLVDQPACDAAVVLEPCPALPWRAGSTAGVAEVRGRWRFCAGARHRAPNEAMRRFFGSTGIELLDSAAGLRLSFLEASEVSSSGSAQLDPATRQLTFTSPEGDRAVWQVTVFDEPRVLRLSALDRWDFVLME